MVGCGRDVVGGRWIWLCWAMLAPHPKYTPKRHSTPSSHPPKADRLGITARDRSLFHVCVLLLLRRFFVARRMQFSTNGLPGLAHQSEKNGRGLERARRSKFTTIPSLSNLKCQLIGKEHTLYNVCTLIGERGSSGGRKGLMLRLSTCTDLIRFPVRHPCRVETPPRV
jgi:hypothetical protein